MELDSARMVRPGEKSLNAEDKTCFAQTRVRSTGGAGQTKAVRANRSRDRQPSGDNDSNATTPGTVR